MPDSLGINDVMASQGSPPPSSLYSRLDTKTGNERNGNETLLDPARAMMDWRHSKPPRV